MTLPVVLTVFLLFPSHLFMAKLILVDLKENEVTHSDEGITGTDSTDGMDYESIYGKYRIKITANDD